MPPPIKLLEREKPFFEKGFERKLLARWDEAWAKLSLPARRLFLDEIRSPVRSEKGILGQPSIAVDSVPAEPLEELRKAQFVVMNELVKGKGVRVFANPDVYDFAARARCLRASRLFSIAAETDALERYVKWTCFESQLQNWIVKILYNRGADGVLGSASSYFGLIKGYRWLDWVVDELDLPRARQLMDHLIEAKAPVPITRFLAGVTGAEGTKRSTLDSLIGHLAIFEDFDPETFDIVVDLLPSVRQGMAVAQKAKVLPNLTVMDVLKELGPTEGIFLSDMRAFLLELASEPMRLKQDESPFAKELERFVTAFDPLPAWLDRLLQFKEGIIDRIDVTFGLAEDLELAKVHTEGKLIQLRLTPEGKKWLGLDPVAQHKFVCKLYREEPDETDLYLRVGVSRFGIYDYDGYEDPSGSGDGIFLGSDISAVIRDKPKTVHSVREVKLKDRLSLRRSIDRVFSTIPVGVYHTLSSIIERLSHPDMNPLHLGVNPEKVVVFFGYRKLPMLEEERRAVTRGFLTIMIMCRFVTLGGYQVAVGKNDEVCVARTPWYDAYFGRDVVIKDLNHAHAIAGSSRVVVQPDFSIVVIGLNPLPLAELAPFCERMTKGGGQGAVILKLTRESVLKAISHGMTSEEILARLDKHAGSALPANVRREAEEWSRWARKVQLETLIVLRCPDKATADRVVSAFKAKVERISDTLVGVTTDQVSSANRTKLQIQGLFIEGQLPAKPKLTKAKPRDYW